MAEKARKEKKLKPCFKFSKKDLRRYTLVKVRQHPQILMITNVYRNIKQKQIVGIQTDLRAEKHFFGLNDIQYILK